jgi:hypothetical protein
MSAGILLATVGNRDPEFGGQPTGPLRAARTLRPETVVLVHTEKTSSNADATRARVEEDAPGTTMRLHRLDGDPSDRARLLEQCRELVEDLRSRGAIRRGWEVNVCATSGTPQMGDALSVAVAARYPDAGHWQALNPSEAGAGASLLRKDRRDAVWILAQVADGLRLLRSGRPEEALGALRRHAELDMLGRSLPYVRVATALARLLARVSEHTLVEAAASLDELRGAVAVAPRPSPAVDRLVTWYGRVVAPREPRVWPLELAAAAERDFAADRRALGVIRLATAAQVAGAARLRERHRIDPTDLGPSRERWAAGLKEEDVGRDRDDGRLYVKTWHVELDLLAVLEGGELVPRRRRRAAALMRARNDLLHTGSGVTPRDLDAAFDEGREYVDWLFDQFRWGRLQDVPSTSAGVRDAVTSLADAAWITPPS